MKSSQKRNRSISPRTNKPKKRKVLSIKQRNSPKGTWGDKDITENGLMRRFTRDRQRREQEHRQHGQENSRQVEERRIVYVGKIAEGTTRNDLRNRFEVFGPIVEISVHFRDRG